MRGSGEDNAIANTYRVASGYVGLQRQSHSQCVVPEPGSLWGSSAPNSLGLCRLVQRPRTDSGGVFIHMQVQEGFNFAPADSGVPWPWNCPH